MPRAELNFEQMMNAAGKWIWRGRLEATNQHLQRRALDVEDPELEVTIRAILVAYREFEPLEKPLLPSLPADETADMKAELMVTTSLSKSEPFNPAVRPQPRVVSTRR